MISSLLDIENKKQELENDVQILKDSEVLAICIYINRKIISKNKILIEKL